MKAYVNKILWAFSFFLVFNNCYAQTNYYFTKNLPFKFNSSLSGIRKINCFMKDSRGYAWFGAQGGLYRYDGYQAKWYSTDEARPNTKSINPVKAITEDKHGNIWIMVGGVGLKKVDHKTDSIVNIPLEIPNDINDISEIVASDDDLWLNSIYGSLRYSISTNKLQTTKHIQKYVDANRNLWGLSTDSAGFNIYQYDKKRDTFISKINLSTFVNYGFILLATKKHIFIASDEKLIAYDIAANKCFLLKNFDNKYIYSMHLNADNSILVHQDSSILLLDPTTFKTKPIVTNSLLYSYSIYPLSNNQLLLVSDNTSRLLNLSPPVIEPYNFRDPFFIFKSYQKAVYPHDAHQINIENAYVADFEKKALFKFGTLNPALKSISRDLSNSDQFVKQYTDKDGMRWYAYFNMSDIEIKIDFYAYNPTTSDLKNVGFYTKYIEPQFSTTGFVKAGDELFFADNRGLNSFDLKTKKWQNAINYKPTDTVTDIITQLYVDNDDDIWISTKNRGFILKKKGQNKFKYYSVKTEDKKNWATDWVSSVIQDKKGTVWVATSKGLFSFDKKTEILKKQNISLPDNFILNIVIDDAQTLWLSHDKGITHYDPYKNTVRHYNEADGILDELIHNGMKLPDGSLVFTTKEQFYRIHPYNVRVDSTPVPIYLTDIQLFNKSIAIKGADSLLKQHISYTKSITFEHYQNIISLHYSAIDFVDAENRQYAYLLEGFDDNWQYVGQKREAVYTNLPYGKYTFRVKSANRDGVWTEMATPLSITVLPPWWKTWWAYLTYILVTIGGIWAFMNYRARNLRRQNKLLEDCVEERTSTVVAQKEELNKTLNELKATQAQLIQSEKLASLGELTAGIAHEIQNPLNFVNNFSELSVDLVKDLKEEMEKPTHDKAYIDELFDDLSQNQQKINHHGKRASSIVKGMLEHSRASTGIKELTDINKLVDEYLRLAYHGLRAKDKDFIADFRTDFDENLPNVNVIPQDMGRVLLNLINNAFYAVNQRKHQDSNNYTPSVLITTQYVDNQVIVKIKDNGIGMTEATKTKIFQPFFTTKPTGQGTGLGLSLAYDIVTKGHGGTLEVESQENEGSLFILKLPV